MLLGGNTGRNAPHRFHDREIILNESGLLRYDHSLAHITYKVGTALMLVTFVWSGYLLLKRYKHIDL